MLQMSSLAVARTWTSPVGEDVDTKPKSCQAGQAKESVLSILSAFSDEFL